MSVAQAAMPEKLCVLEEPQGGVARCPGVECPFWENGCTFERLGWISRRGEMPGSRTGCSRWVPRSTGRGSSINSCRPACAITDA